MTIRLALLAAACLGAAGCTPSVPSLSGTFASLREDTPPPRTCRNVASDAVAMSARATAAAGVPQRDPRIGEGGLTEVAWPAPTPETDPALTERMTAIQAEADAAGCAIAFRESLPPGPNDLASVPPSATEATVIRSGPAAKSAWNAPETTVAPSTGPTVRPATTASPITVNKQAFKPIDRTAARSVTPTDEGALAVKVTPKAKPVAVVTPPRSVVREIPISGPEGLNPGPIPAQ